MSIARWFEAVVDGADTVAGVRTEGLKALSHVSWWVDDRAHRYHADPVSPIPPDFTVNLCRMPEPEFADYLARLGFDGLVVDTVRAGRRTATPRPVGPRRPPGSADG